MLASKILPNLYSRTIRAKAVCHFIKLGPYDSPLAERVYLVLTIPEAEYLISLVEEKMETK